MNHCGWWRERLGTHLDIDAGQIGAGKKRPTKTVDIAVIQTVTRSEQPGELLDGYGLIVVDECHHVPAPAVERALRQIEARRRLGLAATPQRSNGLKQIIIMQCGPIRHRLRQRTDNLDRSTHVHRTGLVVDDATDGLTRGEMLALCNAALVEDRIRCGSNTSVKTSRARWQLAAIASCSAVEPNTSRLLLTGCAARG